MDAPGATPTQDATDVAAAASTPAAASMDVASVISHADALSAAGRLTEAIGLYRVVLRQHPHILGLHFNLGVALLRHEQAAEAVLHFDRIVAAADCPDWLRLRARQGLALALEQSGETAAAAAEYRRLLTLEPHNFQVLRQLATLYRDLGLPERALEAYTGCLTLWPQHCGIALEVQQLRQDLLLGGTNDDENNDDSDADSEAALAAACSQPPPGVEPPAPHTLLWMGRAISDAQVGTVAAAHARYIEQSIGGPATAPPLRSVADRRVRLAYAISDVHSPRNAWVRSLLRGHDRQRFEVLLYTWGPDDGSAEREQAVLDAELSFDLAGWSDAAIAARLRADAVDVLLDPGSNARASRPGLFARRPAPLQLAWLSDPVSAWSGWFDALIEAVPDPSTNPSEAAQHRFASLSWRLPGCAWALPPLAQAPPRLACRRAFGLPERAPVLALLAAPAAIDAALLAVVLRLLRTIPGTALWLRDLPRAARERLRQTAQQAGLDARQLVFTPSERWNELPSALSCADLLLDTARGDSPEWPLAALAAGVPVLSLQGSRHPQQASQSALRSAGEAAVIAPDLAAYERQALHWLQHPRELLALRRRIAEHRSAAQRSHLAGIWNPTPSILALEGRILSQLPADTSAAQDENQSGSAIMTGSVPV